MKPIVVAVTIALVAASTLLWLAWPRETPEYAWAKIHTAACGANVEDFHSRVNWNAIFQSLMAREPNQKGATLEGGRKKLDDDIRLGAKSKWCQAKLYRSDAVAKTIYMTMSDHAFLLRFSLVGGKYVLVDIDDAAPKTSSGQ